MGREIDLMANYPRTKRDPMARAAEKTEADRQLARQFGRDFFDGDRRCGYGGYTYHPRFWSPVMPDFISHFNLTPDSSVLDVGCGKGFMLHDLREAVPGITVGGIDISEYAIGQAMEDVRPFVQVADARHLPFPDHSFDVVISITTVHNFNRAECIQALREIERVGRGQAFITVDAYRNEEERRMMEAWNLTALTVLHVDDWKKLFEEAGYTGDYHWFMP
jgi:SAM-dependent methyltransferase